MGFIELRVYEHPAVPRYEAWLVRRADAAEVPPELRGRVTVPCIITGDAALLAEHLTFLQLAEVLGESGIPTTYPATGTSQGVRHVEAAYV